jgi:peroxiredoxin
LALILCAASIGHVIASPARVKGKAPQYAGMNLVAEWYDNFISQSVQPIAVIKVDNKGNFDVEIEINEITLIAIELGQFRAYMFLEPATEYTIVLPPNIPRPDSERFNPFFKPEEILIGIVDHRTGNLNNAIDKLDERYEDLYNKNAIDLVRRQYIRLADEMITNLDSVNPNVHNQFYLDYLKYRKAIFYSLPRGRQTNAVTRKYFADSPVLYNNPAYWDAIKAIFAGYLDSYQRTSKGKKFAATMKSTSNFDSLSVALSADTLFRNTEFREILLLKHLYDSYYSGQITIEKATALLDNAATTASNNRIKSISLSLSQKINHLKKGSMAPGFVLRNFKGKEVSLDDYRGKFVYLAFLHTQNYACLKDLPALNAVQERFKKDLVVLGIITNEQQDEAEKYLKANKISWTALPFTFSQKIMFDYNISVLPSYFLINPDGKLVLSPAPKPDESFDKIYIDVNQTYKHQQIRKENPKEKSIYDLFR